MPKQTEKNASKPSGGVSRREFARRATWTAIATTLVPAELLAGAPTSMALPVTPAPQQPAGGEQKLSPEGQAEAEAKIQAIFRKYGARLSEQEKADIRRLVPEAQKGLEALRAFPLDNGDEPATVLRPYTQAHPAHRSPHPAATSGSRKPRTG